MVIDWLYVPPYTSPSFLLLLSPISSHAFPFTLRPNSFYLISIPGIPPTQKPVRVPFTSIVNIRGDCLYHEHIAWDQASVLRQIGLLPEYLPFPYPLPDGRLPAKGKRFEYRVPAIGADTSFKMADEESVASNGLLDGLGAEGWAIREVDSI
jgi:carboxymethylenebutenolidase